MNLEKQKHLLFFTVLIVLVLVLLSQYYIMGITPNPETQRFKLWFAIGPHSPFKLENSLLWLSSFNFGTPRLGNPLLVSYSPLSYFGLLIKEPYIGLITWTLSLFLGIWGGAKLFQNFFNNRIIAFTSGSCFALSGVMIITALIGVTIEQIPCTTWTLYFLTKYIKSNNLKFLFVSALIHALHFYISSGFPTWFYLSAFISFYMFSMELNNITINKEKILKKSNLLKMLKNQFIYFGLLFSFLAIMVLPIVEMMPHVTHRHLEIGASGYRYAGRFHPIEFFLFPFLFPGAYKTGNQFVSFVNLSYIGYAPIFFSLIWIKHIGFKKSKPIIVLLMVIILAACSLPPIDTILRLIPPLAEIRLSSMWMFCWNLFFLYLMALSLNRLGNEINLTDALKFSYVCSLITLLLLLFLYIGYLYKFDFGYSVDLPFFNGKSYPLPPSNLINSEYWYWVESTRPVIVSACITLALFLSKKFLVSHNTMLLVIAIIAISDISTWVYKRTLTFSNQYAQLDNQYRNNIVQLERFEGLEPPALGNGRAIFFGTPGNIDKKYKFLAFRQYFESVHPATSLPTKRGFKMSLLLGWEESEMIDAGQIYHKITLEDFLLSKKLQLARSLNIKYFFSNKPISAIYSNKFNLKELKIDEKIGMYLYEDLNVLPRVIRYGKISAVDNQDKAFELIGENKDITLREAVVEIKKIDRNRQLPNSTLSQDNIKILSYTPTKIVVESNSPKNSFIVFSDLPYPGWTATIDDQQQKIYPSNIIGKGIFVDSGYHKIVFEYYPKYYFIGIMLSISGVLAFLTYWLYLRKKQSFG
jgi:hypothetical protein